MTIKSPVSHQHIDAKGFLFKTTEDPSRRKVMLKGYLEHQKATQNCPDQASICDEAVLEGYFENVIGYRLQVTLLKM